MKTIKKEHIELNIYLSNGFSQFGYKINITLKHRNFEENGQKMWRILESKICSRGAEKKEVSDTYHKYISLADKELPSYAKIDSEEVPRVTLSKNYIFDIQYKEELIRWFLTLPDYPCTQNYLPKILKLEEKHGDRYYLLTNPQEASEIYLQVLTERYEDKWYDWMDNYKPYNLVKPEVEVNELPETAIELRKSTAKQWESYNKKIEEAEEYRDTFNDIRDAVMNKNGSSVASILSKLRDGEYEKYELITPENYES